MKRRQPESGRDTGRDTGPGRPLLDRLGARSGMRAALVGFRDADFEAELRGRGVALDRRPKPGLDLLFYFAPDISSLHTLRDLRPLIHDAGAIWVLREKGAGLKVREVDVIDAARRFGLVDNKIASFSSTLAAMRLVVPLANRAPS